MVVEGLLQLVQQMLVHLVLRVLEVRHEIVRMRLILVALSAILLLVHAVAWKHLVALERLLLLLLLLPIRLVELELILAFAGTVTFLRILSLTSLFDGAISILIAAVDSSTCSPLVQVTATRDAEATARWLRDVLDGTCHRIGHVISIREEGLLILGLQLAMHRDVVLYLRRLLIRIELQKILSLVELILVVRVELLRRRLRRHELTRHAMAYATELLHHHAGSVHVLLGQVLRMIWW